MNLIFQQLIINNLQNVRFQGFKARNFCLGEFFSPREKVPAGRMRGKGARPTKVYPIAETSHVIRFLYVSIGRPSFGCLLPIIGSVVEISDFGPRIFLRGWTAYVQPPVAKCEPEMIYEN